MVRDSDGHNEPWLKVFVGLPAVGSVMGWPGDALPVFQQPLCSLPILAVATVLDMGELWLYDRRLRRVIPEGQRCMAILIGPKQLALVQGDNTPGRVAAVLLPLPDGDDNASAKARLTWDPLHLEPVVEAQSSGQRLVIASANCPTQARVDVIVDVVLDYGWRLLPGGKPHLRAVRWPRLLECLAGGSGEQPILAPIDLDRPWQPGIFALLGLFWNHRFCGSSPIENIVCSFMQAAGSVNLSNCLCRCNSMCSCVLWVTLLFPQESNPEQYLSVHMKRYASYCHV